MWFVDQNGLYAQNVCSKCQVFCLGFLGTEFNVLTIYWTVIFVPRCCKSFDSLFCSVTYTTPKYMVARFTSTLWEFYDLHEIHLTQKEALLERRYSSGSMPSLTPNHSAKTCGGPRLSSLPQL